MKSFLVKDFIWTLSKKLTIPKGKIWTYFFSPFSSFNDEKTRCKYYNNRITTRDDVDVQSHEQEESK